MKRAIGEYRLEGIQTNLGFFLEILDDPGFRRGEFDTGFIGHMLRKTQATRASPGSLSLLQDLAIVAAALAATPAAPLSGPQTSMSESLWKRRSRRRNLGS
jgi:pyruvate carboxylase